MNILICTIFLERNIFLAYWSLGVDRISGHLYYRHSVIYQYHFFINPVYRTFSIGYPASVWIFGRKCCIQSGILPDIRFPNGYQIQCPAYSEFRYIPIGHIIDRDKFNVKLTSSVTQKNIPVKRIWSYLIHMFRCCWFVWFWIGIRVGIKIHTMADCGYLYLW